MVRVRDGKYIRTGPDERYGNNGITYSFCWNNIMTRHWSRNSIAFGAGRITNPRRGGGGNDNGGNRRACRVFRRGFSGRSFSGTATTAHVRVTGERDKRVWIALGYGFAEGSEKRSGGENAERTMLLLLLLLERVAVSAPRDNINVARPPPRYTRRPVFGLDK